MTVALPSYAEAATVVAARAAEFLRSDLRSGRAVERVELSAAAGRVIAEPLRADRDQPSFPRSTRDGFACRAAEVSTHRALTIAGATRAGQAPAGPLPANSAWEIMTGAPVPAGADAIAMVEHVEVAGDEVRLVAPRTLAAGDNIVPQGAEARAGDELVLPGTRIGPAHIALAATCGYA